MLWRLGVVSSLAPCYDMTWSLVPQANRLGFAPVRYTRWTETSLPAFMLHQPSDSMRSFAREDGKSLYALRYRVFYVD